MQNCNFKLKIIFPAIIFCCFFGWAESSWAAEIQAVSCEQADVQVAINSAQAGDTVLLSQCLATWNNSLIITKGITLKGVGSEMTIIKGNLSDSNRAIIEYKALSYANEKFRLSGLTLDANGKSYSIWIGHDNGAKDYVVENVRIDNNIITSTGNTLGFVFKIVGTAFGVVDNNIINGAISNEQGDQYLAFDNLSNNFGNHNNIYFEDNIITAGNGNAFTSGHGSRYVARYNDISMIRNDSSTTSFDVHGNMNGPSATNIIFESYGNLLNHQNNNSCRLGFIHGGKNLAFYNYISQNIAVIHISEFFNDGLYSYGNISGSENDFILSSGIPADAIGNANVRIVSGTGFGQDFPVASIINNNHGKIEGTWNPSPSGIGFLYYTSGPKSERKQHVNDSYFWNNRRPNKTLVPVQITGDYFYNSTVSNSPAVLIENREFWQDNLSFNGTSGVGCGTLSNRPATCTTGVGYWATNQSCADLTGMVGAHPTTPISGTLYKCVSQNTWEPYYTPYTYPHPLRNEDNSLIPAAPSGLSVQ